MSPEGSSSGLDPLFGRRSLPGMLHPWARAGSRRFPGDPSQAFALLQDPGRADTTSPLAVVPTPPPGKPNRRPQRVHNLEANTGLQLPLSTLHERRHRLPCKTRFRLAGCASTGRVSNPLGRFERFQVTFHSPFQDFSCRKVRLHQAALRRARSSALLSRPLHPSRRHLEQSAHRARRERRDLPLQGLSPQRAGPVLHDEAPPDEFIRRFLLHVLPKGFHRIRHYGLLASAGCKANIARAKELMTAAIPEVDPPTAHNIADPGATTDHRPPCPCCGGRMIIVEVFARGGTPRGPPSGAGIGI